MRPEDKDSQFISEQAARWVAALQTGGSREHEAFAKWLRSSPLHVREYLLLSALETDLDDSNLQRFDVQKLLARSADRVVTLPTAAEAEQTQQPTRLDSARARWWTGTLAAGIAIVGIIGWQVNVGRAGFDTYETATGEQRTFKLADGSFIQLNPQSRIRVSFSAQARDVRLLEGEAIFKVEHDPARPFRVHTNDTLIEDIGTEFHVHRRSTATVVSVIEGAVEISPEPQRKGFSFARPESPSVTAPADVGFEPLRTAALIIAGEEARIAVGGKAIKRRAVDSARMTSADQRHLTFSGDTLADIVEDFNRYNRSPQLRVEGEALRLRRFSGGFDADDPLSLVEYLRQAHGVVVRTVDEEIVVSQR